MSVKTISPQAFEALRKADERVVLIDVRSPYEFRAGHAAMARSLPLDHLDEPSLGQLADRATPLVLICQGGQRAAKACAQASAWGYREVYTVEGGTAAWRFAGLPMIAERNVISLLRQVRIVTGMLVVLGCLLALLVHVWFIGMVFFVGFGLLFAGLTDSCPMGVLLAKMPWNRGCGGCGPSRASDG